MTAGENRVRGLFVAIVGHTTRMALLLWIIAAVLVIFGIVRIVQGDILWGVVLIVAGLLAAVAALIVGLPHDVSFTQALHVAGAAGRLNALDFHFDWNQTYTFWSGLLGGLFLMLSYFGCDQSQVQRYLTAKSIDQARHSLRFSLGHTSTDADVDALVAAIGPCVDRARASRNPVVR